MICLIVSMDVRPSRRQEFLEAIKHNAISSFEQEQGCHRFDVSQDEGNPDRFYLYEIYEDQEAVEAHRSSSHYADWTRAAAEFIEPGTKVVSSSKLLASHA